MARPLRIDLWDATSQQWRAFDVVPYEPNFKPECKHNLHQFWPGRAQCACNAMTRTIERTVSDGR